MLVIRQAFSFPVTEILCPLLQSSCFTSQSLEQVLPQRAWIPDFAQIAKIPVV